MDVSFGRSVQTYKMSRPDSEDTLNELLPGGKTLPGEGTLAAQQQSATSLRTAATNASAEAATASAVAKNARDAVQQAKDRKPVDTAEVARLEAIANAATGKSIRLYQVAQEAKERASAAENKVKLLRAGK